MERTGACGDWCAWRTGACDVRVTRGGLACAEDRCVWRMWRTGACGACGGLVLRMPGGLVPLWRRGPGECGGLALVEDRCVRRAEDWRVTNAGARGGSAAFQHLCGSQWDTVDDRAAELSPETIDVYLLTQCVVRVT